MEWREPISWITSKLQVKLCIYKGRSFQVQLWQPTWWPSSPGTLTHWVQDSWKSYVSLSETQPSMSFTHEVFFPTFLALWRQAFLLSTLTALQETAGTNPTGVSVTWGFSCMSSCWTFILYVLTLESVLKSERPPAGDSRMIVKVHHCRWALTTS